MDREQIDSLIRRIQRDSGGAFVSGLGYIGDRLGIFRALAEHGPVDSLGLAEATGLQERYLREWLRAMAAFGYVEMDRVGERYALSAEQRAVLVDEASPFFGAGTFQFTLPSLLHTEEIVDAFRAGGGVAYERLHPEIPESIDRMHRAWFEHLLTGQWIPDIPGLPERLSGGLRVLDVGCGLGRSTAAMARGYPRSTFLGIDPHRPSIERADALAAGHDGDNLEFRCLALERLPETERFDLIVAIDCIHDMVDPVGVLRAIRERLAPDGLFLWSEPAGSTDPSENTAPLPRLRAALSIYHCLTVSLAAGGAGLGTLIGETGARELAELAGYTEFETLPVRSETQMFFGLRR